MLIGMSCVWQAVQAFPALHRLPGKVKILRSRWGSEPLARGSYAYVAAGASVKDVDTLARPLMTTSSEGLPMPRVCFAGESTHLRFIGTTHGAYMTGQREAQRLLDAFGLSEA